MKIPIQALTVRQKSVLEEAAREARGKGSEAVGSRWQQADRYCCLEVGREEVTGVFVVEERRGGVHPCRNRDHRLHRYRDYKGVWKEACKIMVGPYQTIRNLRPGSRVIIDNSTGVNLEQKG